MFLTFVMEPHFERNCRISGEERSDEFMEHESSFIDNVFSTLLVASFLVKPRFERN